MKNDKIYGHINHIYLILFILLLFIYLVMFFSYYFAFISVFYLISVQPCVEVVC